MLKLKLFSQKHPRAGILIILLLATLAVLPYAYSRTAQVTLAWDLSDPGDLAGYRVYYGNDKSVYLINVDANQTQSFTIPDLKIGETYYFAISAYDTGGTPEGSDAKLIMDLLRGKEGVSAGNRSHY